MCLHKSTDTIEHRRKKPDSNKVSLRPDMGAGGPPNHYEVACLPSKSLLAKLNASLRLRTVQPGPQLWRVVEIAQTQEGLHRNSAVYCLDLGTSLNLSGSLMP